MKYCSNCGNPVGDDMNFCQKCGTRVAINSNKEEVVSKIELLRQYNLVYDRKSVTWKYITDDPERAMELIAESQKLVQSFCDLCKEILKENNSTVQDIVEQEIYLTVLKQGYTLCKTTEVFLLNYSGYQETFKNFQKLVEKNCITSMKASETISDMDSLYRCFSLMNLLYSSNLKQILDEKIISNNKEYRKHLIKFAQAFNNAILAFEERCSKVFFVPGEEAINQNWDLYTNILKGLHISDIDELDETGWLKLLKDYSAHEGNKDYETHFLTLRNHERNIEREKAKQILDAQYWSLHPEEKKLADVNNSMIVEIESQIKVLEKDILELRQRRPPLTSKKRDCETNIYIIDKKIEKLKNKIFGRKKTDIEIFNLQEELQSENQNLNRILHELENIDGLISNKVLAKDTFDKKIQELKEKNKMLRNQD